jgi:hypothetical protein
MTEQPKPGIKTTEFWVAISVAFLGATALVFTDNPWAQVGGLFAASVGGGTYILSRGNVKRGPTHASVGGTTEVYAAPKPKE